MDGEKPVVAHVTPWYLPHIGGLERHVEAICLGLEPFRHVVLTPRLRGTAPSEAPTPNVTVLRFGPMRIPAQAEGGRFQSSRDWVGRVARFVSLMGTLQSLDRDLVHVHRPPLIELAYLASRRLDSSLLRGVSKLLNRLRVAGVPRVITDHGLFVVPSTVSSLDLTWFMRFVLEEFDHVIVVDRGGFARATALREAIPRRGPCAQLHNIPQPIDTQLFAYKPLPETDDLVIGYTGRWERDGMFLLRDLVQANLPGIRFHISGGATDRDLATYRHAFAGPNVTLRPNITAVGELPGFYHGIHLLVDFYRGDGCGRSLLEAMACGRPVLRMQAEDTFPVIPGENGFLSIPSVEEIAGQVRALADDRSRLASMGRQGRAIIEREFAYPVVLGRIEAVYRSCLEGKADSS